MIEDIIVQGDTRGMSQLRKVLPVNFCQRAAAFLRDNLENVLICTGFYVSGFCETDGPVGAVMLAEALTNIGADVSLITDEYCFHVINKVTTSPVHVFPIKNTEKSRETAEGVLSAVDPSLLISVERCGRARSGLYYNMRGEDISAYTAKIDYLFDFPRTIGIGDGGNEIGMGNVYNEVKKAVLHGGRIASVVETTHLLISSVSNWGVYGLLAYLSRAEKKVLLKKEDHILQRVVKAGAVDSSCLRPVLAADGFSLAETNCVIEKLLDEVGATEMR
jgi:hypothetical protein